MFQPNFDIKIGRLGRLVQSGTKMVLVHGLVRVEHQIVVDAVDALLARSGVIIVMELCHGHVKVIQPHYKIVPEGSVPFSVCIHPFLIVVLLQFFQKMEQVFKIHWMLCSMPDAHCLVLKIINGVKLYFISKSYDHVHQLKTTII